MRTTRSKSGILKEGKKRQPKAVSDDGQEESDIGTAAPERQGVKQTSKLMCMPLDIWFENCGRASVDIDWQLLMRVCEPCRRVYSFNSKRFQREFPGEDASVLPLVLYTNIHQGWASPTTYYWRSDVERMLRIVARYKGDIAGKKPGAEAAYKEFRERRIARVLSVVQSAPQYKSWHSEVRSESWRELAKLAEERKSAIRARLLQIGHDPRDVEHVMTNGDIEVERKELTEASWRRIKKKWETQVAKARRRRLATDHPGIIGQRKRAAARVYNEVYHRNVGPLEWFTLEWLTLPPAHEVIKLEPLWEPVYSDVDADVPDAAFQKALRACASAIRKHKSDNIYSVRRAFDDVPKEVKKGGMLLKDAGVDVLDLAVATCKERWHSSTPFSEQCLSAKEYLFRRSYCMSDCNPEYCSDLSGVVVALLDAVNRSPATTTFAGLDQLDPRFFCSLCPPQEIGGTWTRLSFKWRSAVLHYNEHHAEKQEIAKFRALSATEAGHARRNEIPELADAKTWSCAHCGEHLDNWQRQCDVEAHARKRHDIAAPKIGADVLCVPVVLVNVKPVRVSVDSPLNSVADFDGFSERMHDFR
ncbi:uncharacterized protein SCHCODRAFT_02503613 [Schizophyllum commune H4-8]|uniref:Uncharacterized protein n=1 Tax=Schizophyllum commune (strain H4-8 / FGSC 9210) TaxID=578458 RepID=D8Q581_SCHCM|nr:uncharacterized protein SCHCODRAFT_02503613 [Schizophyllum commune H4-8]KAI5892297.1 hypothetical protein SCHCODRAFT_02503613 [Schizophyllum commune H4-8]